jgi:hypothetical protein
MLKRDQARTRRRAATTPPAPDPLARLSTKAMLREIVRRQRSRLRRGAR